MSELEWEFYKHQSYHAHFAAYCKYHIHFKTMTEFQLNFNLGAVRIDMQSFHPAFCCKSLELNFCVKLSTVTDQCCHGRDSNDVTALS